MKNIFYLFVILMITFSCKKEVVEIPESNDPVFHIQGKIGNEEVNYYVGDNSTIFSYNSEIINKINYFNGKLQYVNSQLELGIYGGNNDLNIIDLNSLIAHSSLEFAQLPFDPVFEINKDFFQSNLNIKEIKWFVDGVYAGTNYLKIIEPGKYVVCAKIYYLNQGYAEVCNEILVGFERKNEFELMFSLNQDNELNAWIENSSNSTVTEVKWFIEDELINENTNLFTTISNGLKTLKAEIKFNNGVKKIRNVIVDGNHLNRNFDDFASQEKKSSVKWDYKIKLNYKNNTDEYSSMNYLNDSSSLVLQSVNFLGNDSQNIPVYIFKGNLKSKIKSKASNEILDVNLFISWGLGIK